MKSSISTQRSYHAFGKFLPLSSTSLVQVVVALTTVLGAVAASSTEPIPTRQSELEFEVEDQFGRRYDASEFVDQPFILVGGDKDASNETRAWALEARKLVGVHVEPGARIQILRVADLRAVPAGLRGLVARKMRSRYDTPILLDWQGVLSDQFGFRPGLANVVIVDELGEVRLLLQAMEPKPQQIDLLKRVLIALGSSKRGEESAPSRTNTAGADL